MAKKVAERPISVPDLHATIHCALGIDPANELYDGDRPVPITDQGKPIRGIVRLRAHAFSRIGTAKPELQLTAPWQLVTYRLAAKIRLHVSLAMLRTQSQPRHSMARKVLNRRELRAAAEAAANDRRGRSKKAKKPTARKSRAKTAKEVRLKAFWGVFNQSMKRIAVFEYAERKQADKKAAEMTASGKSPHFVQLVKEVIEDVALPIAPCDPPDDGPAIRTTKSPSSPAGFMNETDLRIQLVESRCCVFGLAMDDKNRILLPIVVFNLASFVVRSVHF